MKNASAIRNLLYSSATLALLIFCFSTAASGQRGVSTGAVGTTNGNNSGGVGRGDNGQIVRVTVKLGDKLVPGVRVRVKTADGTAVTSGITSKTGAFNVPLDAGVYTIYVNNPVKGTASSSVTVVKSTDPALLTLTLAPPPSSPATN